jgi:hypothetical protein
MHQLTHGGADMAFVHIQSAFLPNAPIAHLEHLPAMIPPAAFQHHGGTDTHSHKYFSSKTLTRSHTTRSRNINSTQLRLLLPAPDGVASAGTMAVSPLRQQPR